MQVSLCNCIYLPLALVFLGGRSLGGLGSPRAKFIRSKSETDVFVILYFYAACIVSYLTTEG